MSEVIIRGAKIWLWMMVFAIGYVIMFFIYEPISDRLGIPGILIMIVGYVLMSWYAIGYGARRTED